MTRSVLVIDDEDEVRESIAGVLRDEGYRVITASDGLTAFERMSNEMPDAILLDMWLTNATGERHQEGIELLSKIKDIYPEAVVVMMSGHGNIESAVRATKLGAFDFLEKPLSLEKMLVLLQNAFQLRDLTRENKSLRTRVARSSVMIGETPVMVQLKQTIKRVAQSHSWILISGENGTGKELVANAIHAGSSRYSRPLIEVNCAAIPEDLIESELFGHEKGAFTGATQQRRGKFDLAHEGTLFLDEIGDMSLKTQAKILRILQEQRFERVGGNQTISVDVRVIAATNKDLEDQIRKGLFREDLYHRLCVVPVRVPSLRERTDDVPLLANYYLKEFTPDQGKQKTFSGDALRLLQSYRWPGNVRELRNTIERLVIFSDNGEISSAEVAAVIPELAGVAEVKGPILLKDAKSEFEREYILRTLKENDFNVTKTAQILGVERSHLHKKIKSFEES